MELGHPVLLKDDFGVFEIGAIEPSHALSFRQGANYEVLNARQALSRLLVIENGVIGDDRINHDDRNTRNFLGGSDAILNGLLFDERSPPLLKFLLWHQRQQLGSRIRQLRRFEVANDKGRPNVGPYRGGYTQSGRRTDIRQAVFYGQPDRLFRATGALKGELKRDPSPELDFRAMPRNLISFARGVIRFDGGSDANGSVEGHALSGFGSISRVNERSPDQGDSDKTNQNFDTGDEHGPKSPFRHVPLGSEIVLSALIAGLSVWTMLRGFYRAGDAIEAVLDGRRLRWLGVVSGLGIVLLGAMLGASVFAYWAAQS